MKKLAAALTVVIATTVLVAPSATAGPKDDRLFYRLVTAEEPSFKAIGRKQLVKTARTTCKTLRRTSLGILDIHQMMMDSGFSQDEATTFVAGAVVFYCPEQETNW